MTRKPSLGAALRDALNTSAEMRETYKAQPRVTPKARARGKTNITYFVEIGTHRRLKELALARDTSLQQLLDEAVDEWLARQLEDPIKSSK